ncbi:MAG: hypothetical protein ABI377_11565 [Devosia sp.]
MAQNANPSWMAACKKSQLRQLEKTLREDGDPNYKRGMDDAEKEIERRYKTNTGENELLLCVQTQIDNGILRNTSASEGEGRIFSLCNSQYNLWLSACVSWAAWETQDDCEKNMTTKASFVVVKWRAHNE